MGDLPTSAKGIRRVAAELGAGVVNMEEAPAWAVVGDDCTVWFGSKAMGISRSLGLKVLDARDCMLAWGALDMVTWEVLV
jgi:hypothetical protein